MTLDMYTLVIINCLVSVLNTFVLLALWLWYRKHYAGIFLLFVDMLMQTAGFSLSLMRAELSPMISIVLATVLNLSGALCVLIGLEIFFNLRRKHGFNVFLIGIFACIMTYFSVYQPNLAVREICVSAMICIINTQTCWLLLRRTPNNYRKVAIFTLGTLFLYILISLTRVIVLFVLPYKTNNFFEAGMFDATVVTIYLALSILITMSFIVLVSRRLLMEVQKEKEKYGITFDTTAYAIMITRMKDGKILEVNEGFEKITGYMATETIGKTTVEIRLWEKDSDRNNVIKLLSEGYEVKGQEIRFRKKDGENIYGLYSGKLMDIDGEKCIITNIGDISEIVNLRDDLHELATHDYLTGLPNRKLFYDRFEIAKANAKREGGSIAVLSADINLLKQINDSYGHASGDLALTTISERMTSMLRSVDSISRFGGDEFVILIWGVKNQENIVKVIENLKAKVAEPIRINGDDIVITISIGSARFPEDAETISDLLKIADARMYSEKRKYQN